MDSNSTIYVGFITYGKSTAKYLPYFLPSLKGQTYKNIKILAVDNTELENNENSDFLYKNYPEIELIWPGKNLGFAVAMNMMLKKAVKNGGKYFLALNPDLLLADDMVANLAAEMENNADLGSACPKLLKWDFEKNNLKTNLIDSCGIKLLPGLRFVDLGRNETDNRQYDNAEILGPSGAAAIYRLSALEKVKEGEDYFDSSMFMYKEDCDLAYRLFLAGFKSKCVSKSIAYHDRSVGALRNDDLSAALNRANKSRQEKKWSFLNQQIIFFKFWREQNACNKLAILWFELKMVAFALLFETYLLKEFKTLYKIRNGKQ